MFILSYKVQPVMNGDLEAEMGHGGTLYWLASRPKSSSFSAPAQTHLPRDSTAHSEMSPPTAISD